MHRQVSWAQLPSQPTWQVVVRISCSAVTQSILAKARMMKRMGYEDETLINEAISYADTDDEAILSARETNIKKLYAIARPTRSRARLTR